MRYFSTSDPRNKKGFKVSSFNHSLHKNKRFVTGKLLEKPYFFKSEEVFHRVCIYIKQKDKVVGLLTAVVSDWDHYFHKASYDEMKKQCRKNKILHEGFQFLDDQLTDVYEFDKHVFDCILSEDMEYGNENGFVIIDKLWVHPYCRKQGYADAMIKLLRKRYDGEMAIIISSQPLNAEEEKLVIKERKIKEKTFDDLVSYNCNKTKEKINEKIIQKMFRDFCDISYKSLGYGRFYRRTYFSAVDFRLCNRIDRFSLPF